MYDELIKKLWECVSGECWNCSQRKDGYDGQRTCADKLMKQAADAIEELTAINERQLLEIAVLSKPRWIPVTERLPDVWKHVITFDEDDGVRVNWRCGDNVSWSMGYHVTHWMPLPSTEGLNGG